MKVMGAVPVLLIWTGRVDVVPSTVEPKVSDAGLRVSGLAVEVDASETNSSAVAAFERISSEAMCVPGVCGVAVTVIVQVLPGRVVVQVEELV